MRIGLAPWAFAGALAAITPASAAPQCLAHGTSFEIGQSGCITLSGKSYLARCDQVLNNTSWTKLQEGCSHGTAAPGSDAKAQSEAVQPAAPKPAQPSEPNAN
jgi:hypothetical protein